MNREDEQLDEQVAGCSTATPRSSDESDDEGPIRTKQPAPKRMRKDKLPAPNTPKSSRGKHVILIYV